MAYANHTNSGLDRHSALGGIAARIVAFASALGDSWRRARIYRETYAELDGLSTRDLADLGLSRSMISRVAFEAAYGPQA